MISVCMAVYNGEEYLHEQVDSILSQLGCEDELIVSDDGSTDMTVEILKGYCDARIKIVKNTLNKGVKGNFENALRQAKGDYIFLADQDDVWLPGKVANCVAALKDNMCVVHDCYIVDKNLNVVKESFFKDKNCKSGFFHNWLRNGYLGCAMSFRRELLPYILPIPEKLPVFHDIWIGLIAEYKFGVKFIPVKGLCYRRHGDNVSVTSDAKFSLMRQIEYRVKELPFILKRIITTRSK